MVMVPAPRPDLHGLTLVVGLGVSGLSATRALAHLGASFAVVDTRSAPPGLAELDRIAPEAEVCCGDFGLIQAEALFARAARLIVSPGISVRTPAIAACAARGVPVWGDIELFARLTDVPVIGITGSNGKSTVTTLLGEMATAAGVRPAVGGNLGTAALDLWLEREAAGDVPGLYVLELSSFQLETTHSLACVAATVLNVSADHLDRYDGMDDYAAAKARLFERAAVQVVNRDDARVRAMIRPERPVIGFGSDRPPAAGDYGLERHGDTIRLMHGATALLDAAELRIGGLHNALNVLAALALGAAAGLPLAPMLAAARAFAGLAHRTQLVAEHAGVRWYDDSKGTNVGATVAAIAGLPGRLVLIAGGDGKGQDFAPLAEALDGRARAVVLLGRDAPRIEAALAGRLPCERVADMEQAVARAAALAQPGDIVLPSPACASLDMYRSYAERGRLFAQAARRVAGSC